MGFVIDRSLVTNKTTLLYFYELFCTIVAKRYEKEMSNNSSGVNNPLLERTILKDEFIILLNELGKKVFHNDRNYQDRVYNELLS